MDKFSQTQTFATDRQSAILLTLLHGLIGSIFLSFLSQVSLPLQPVPMTLQTLGVFLLALTQTKERAALSCLFYLVEASMGMPVLAGWTVNPLWMISARAGFLCSFPIAAYLIGFILEKWERPSILQAGAAVVLGQLTIYFFGVAWLSFLVGFQKAWMVGIVPFLPAAFFKMGFATFLFESKERVLHYFNR